MSPFGLRRSGQDVAIDLGTANTVVFVRGEGVVVAEPSVVALEVGTGMVHAVGADAKRMIGRTPASIRAVRPLRHGVIADFEVTEQMLRHFLARAMPRRRARPRLVLCAPSGITDVERRALVEAAEAAGARSVALIEEPIAAAIGAGLSIAEPIATMVVDIGGGTSEVAVIALGSMVVSESLRLGGYDLDDAVTNHLRNAQRLAIGSESAEEIKHALGSAWPSADRGRAEIRGRGLVDGLPKSVSLASAEIREAFAPILESMIETVGATLEQTPPELAGDVAERGIRLAGGGALLPGLPELVYERTGIAASVVENPLTCVAEGAGQALEDYGTVLKASKTWVPAPRRAAAGS
jgi:rod shape-determining protein MreB and related proteins